MSSRGFQGSYYRKPRGRGPYRGFRGSRRPYGRSFADNNRSYDTNTRSWKRDTPAKVLTEKDIGVTEYISKHEGFNGIIKSRFSDFQVSEINEKGEIAKLTDTSVPEPPDDGQVVEDEDLLLNKYNLEILPMETWDKINDLTLSNGPVFETVKVDVTGKSKEERTKIHDAVKKAFGDSIVGSTVTDDDKKYCSFEKYRKGVRIDNRVKWLWPGEYVQFIVYKENCDTMEAASRIIKSLRLNSSAKTGVIGYAGTKDRRAKTSQWFSLRKVDPRKVAAACRSLQDITVGNFTFSDVHLRLGMLKGNRFRICLRNVTASDEVIDKCCSLLRENGFINYYGLQRFGSRISVPTWQIGLHLLKNNLEAAVNCILKPRPGPLEEALVQYETWGAKAAASKLPYRLDHAVAEGRLIAELAHHPKDFAKALDKVPRNTRLLYVHSYQSLIWNKVVSRRLQTLGPTPQVGDLVSEDSVEEEPLELEDEATEEESEEKQIKQDAPKKLSKVKILTQEDKDSGKYSIFDIVLPLPGHSVVYSPNMKDYYEELLKADGLDLEMKNSNKSYSVCGGYRNAVVRAKEVSWRSLRYSEPLADLLLSDLDLLKGRPEPANVDDGKYKALLVDMTLPTSCYATMALRELLRVDTSSETQAQQNDYHKSDSVKKDANDISDVAVEGDVNEDGVGAEKRKLEGSDDEDVKKAKL
ncbi:pseudouridylate synthase 7 homolog [Pieris napi]|uniref:pseudouridylate synthase 7 homolog n=1 Tax=Pieris napi TaxID=78633 RepID=UPI001FBA17D3|nr:pseudouridylate synthase 7 homolog [Pieris napi]